MIVVRLTGGLGNQMFQYALGRTISLARGVPLRVDIGVFASDRKRAYRLDNLKIQAEVATPADMRGLRPRFRKLARRSETLFGRSPRRVFERGPGFDPTVFDCASTAYLDGYWQSERYFADIRDTLLEDFQPRRPLSEGRQELLARIAETTAVSVHVRRGDYVTNAKVSAFHGYCSADWYRAAMQAMAAQVENPTFFVFSDDPAWVRSDLGSDWPMHVVDFADDREYEDLHVMARCRHHVIANSSFSWWGAWLNQRADKTVIAPRQWLRAGDIDPRDLVPADWQRL